MSDPKAVASEVISRCSAHLVELSERIHANPELGWQEHLASGWVADVLAGAGFGVERPYLGFDTALRASFGTGPHTVGLCAEYDALPGLGHACGHNLIAAMAVGAALALAEVAEEVGLKVVVYGTPAEEGLGGKCELLDRGAFTELDLVMMAHPAPEDDPDPAALAVSHSHISYQGKAAHAAGAPQEGVNAADAFTIAQTAIGLLRQQLPAPVRVHGVVTNAGEAANAIAEHTEGRWYVRAETLEELHRTEERVWKCFEAGALATGCTLQITPESRPYSEMRTDQGTLALYRANLEKLGRVIPEGPGVMSRASTDFANVSQVVEAIHPYIGIGSLPAVNHQKEFAAACVGPTAERALLDGATALAWTAIDRFARSN